MLSVIGDVFSSMMLWVGWIVYRMLFYYQHGTHDQHWAPLLEPFLIGICASILLFSVKLLRRVSSHGR